MASGKFVIMMNDIRGLVNSGDIDYVRTHAEPLSPGDFVPSSPDMSTSKFGGRVPPKIAGAVVTVFGIVGVALAACVAGVVVYKLRRAARNS